MKVVVLNWENYLSMGGQYVDRMRRMVAEHLTIPYELVVVTERDLTSDKHGWFCKLDLLEMFDGWVLYLDLDITITTNIDHLVDIARTDPTRIWARNDFSYPVTDGCKIEREGYAGPLMNNGREATINSSVMIWNGRKDMSGVIPEMLRKIHGDQGIITRMFWPDGIGLLPEDMIKSYKYHKGQTAPIIVHHGRPKPHEVAGWA